MQHNSTPDAPAEVRMVALEAIARRVLLRAQYNGQALTLAPHALFSRRGDLYLSALNLAKNWADEHAKHLGYFKLAGLKNTKVTGEPFIPLADSGPLLAHPDDQLVLAVE